MLVLEHMDSDTVFILAAVRQEWHERAMSFKDL
jgi:hypothetical protein